MKFVNLRSEPLSYKVAKQIRQQILSGDIQAGEQLPEERELAKLFNVSRTTIREGIRELKALGLIDVRRGAGGGIFAIKDNTGSAVNNFSFLMEMNNPSLDELLESRKEVELFVSKLAANRATDDDLKRLKESIEELEDFVTKNAGKSNFRKEFMDINLRFHVLCAEAAKNNIMLITMQVLDKLIRKYSEKIPLEVEIARGVVEFHKDIYEAYKKRDPELAAECTEEHLVSFEKRIRSYTEKYGGPET